jgi:hypothetical protein
MSDSISGLPCPSIAHLANWLICNEKDKMSDVEGFVCNADPFEKNVVQLRTL